MLQNYLELEFHLSFTRICHCFSFLFISLNKNDFKIINVYFILWMHNEVLYTLLQIEYLGLKSGKPKHKIIISKCGTFE